MTLPLVIPIKINKPLHEKDVAIHRILEKINNNSSEKTFVDDLNKIKKMKNPYLPFVVEKYKKVLKDSADEKKAQEAVLLSILNHLENVQTNLNNVYSKEQIQHLHKQKDETFRQLSQIQQELDTILQNI
tara:strand:- start:3175 stop:3564 length:390 start_codon:yes stop_codon:yes gene_type:complete